MKKIRGVMYIFFLKHKLNNTTAQADNGPNSLLASEKGEEDVEELEVFGCNETRVNPTAWVH